MLGEALRQKERERWGGYGDKESDMVGDRVHLVEEAKSCMS